MNFSDFSTSDINNFEYYLKTDAMLFSKKETIANCPLCNSCNNKQIIKKYDFKILECECSFQYLAPRPTKEELLNFYKNGLSSKSWHQILNQTAEVRKLNYKRNIAPLFTRLLDSGRLLDIGSGAGLWLDVLKELKPSLLLEGLEPFGSSNHIIHKQFLEDFKPKYKYDYITCLSLLEHLLDPMPSLKQMCNLLDKNGLIFITVPNLKGFDALALPPEERNWVIPQHLNFFNPTVLNKAMKVAGFEILELETHGRFDTQIIKETNNYFINYLLKEKPEILQEFIMKNKLSGQIYVIGRKI